MKTAFAFIVIFLVACLWPAAAHPKTFPAAAAKSEPAHGCYFSAFVGPDLSVHRQLFRLGGPRRSTLEAALGSIVHKDIAVEWQYFNYDDPAEIAGSLRTWKDSPFAIEVALEPRHGLQEVRDDETLHEHARAMAAYGRPLFLRFASEMNGAWTPYSGDPAQYRAKFRLVHDVMAREAPNVVMVWCVSSTPRATIDRYYPGDRYVDWVGVNFYSVIHHEGDIRQPAWNESPTAMLDGVYRKYAARKPIAICEYGAAHAESLQPGVDRSDWAAGKLAALLRALPTRYPRVKMIGLLNVNGLQKANIPMTGPKLNDFCFTDSPAVALALGNLLASDYYLSNVVDSRSLPASSGF